MSFNTQSLELYEVLLLKFGFRESFYTWYKSISEFDIEIRKVPDNNDGYFMIRLKNKESKGALSTVDNVSDLKIWLETIVGGESV